MTRHITTPGAAVQVVDDGYCCESLRRYGTCACPGREQVIGR